MNDRDPGVRLDHRISSLLADASTKAAATFTPSWAVISILFVIRMTLGAMRRKNALDPPALILLARDKFEMIRPDARPDSATMIPLKSLGWLPDEKMMSKDALSIEGEQAVSLGAFTQRNPAGAKIGAMPRDRAVLINLSPKALSRRARHVTAYDNEWRAVFIPAPPVGSTKAT